MTIKVFVAMSTTNSQMVQKKYICIYLHTLYTHAYTFIYTCIYIYREKENVVRCYQPKNLDSI